MLPAHGAFVKHLMEYAPLSLLEDFSLHAYIRKLRLVDENFLCQLEATYKSDIVDNLKLSPVQEMFLKDNYWIDSFFCMNSENEHKFMDVLNAFPPAEGDTIKLLILLAACILNIQYICNSKIFSIFNSPTDIFKMNNLHCLRINITNLLLKNEIDLLIALSRKINITQFVIEYINVSSIDSWVLELNYGHSILDVVCYLNKGLDFIKRICSFIKGSSDSFYTEMALFNVCWHANVDVLKWWFFESGLPLKFESNGNNPNFVLKGYFTQRENQNNSVDRQLLLETWGAHDDVLKLKIPFHEVIGTKFDIQMNWVSLPSGKKPELISRDDNDITIGIPLKAVQAHDMRALKHWESEMINENNRSNVQLHDLLQESNRVKNENALVFFCTKFKDEFQRDFGLGILVTPIHDLIMPILKDKQTTDTSEFIRFCRHGREDYAQWIVDNKIDVKPLPSDFYRRLFHTGLKSPIIEQEEKALPCLRILTSFLIDKQKKNEIDAFRCDMVQNPKLVEWAIDNKVPYVCSNFATLARNLPNFRDDIAREITKGFTVSQPGVYTIAAYSAIFQLLRLNDDSVFVELFFQGRVTFDSNTNSMFSSFGIDVSVKTQQLCSLIKSPRMKFMIVLAHSHTFICSPLVSCLKDLPESDYDAAKKHILSSKLKFDFFKFTLDLVVQSRGEQLNNDIENMLWYLRTCVSEPLIYEIDPLQYSQVSIEGVVYEYTTIMKMFIELLKEHNISDRFKLSLNASVMTQATLDGSVKILKDFDELRDICSIRFAYDAIQVAFDKEDIETVGWWIESGHLGHGFSLDLDEICSRGRVNLLQWAFDHREKVKLTYTSNALDSATDRGRLTVLEWWTDKKAALPVKSITARKSHMNIKNVAIKNWWILHYNPDAKVDTESVPVKRKKSSKMEDEQIEEKMEGEDKMSSRSEKQEDESDSEDIFKSRRRRTIKK